MIVDPVIGALAAVAGAVVQELGAGLAERLWRRTRDPQVSPAKARRLLQRSADDLVPVLATAGEAVSSGDRAAVTDAVRASLEAAAPIDLTDALAHDLRAERLAEHVRTEASDVLDAAALSDDAAVHYDRLLVATCEQILVALARVPGFADVVQIAGYQGLQDVLRGVDVLVGVHDAAAQAGARFERRYRGHVTRTLGGVELFGLRRGHASRALPFDTAYVSVAVARSGGPRTPGDDELTGAGVEVGAALAEHPRVLLRGGAGAGKTTLLRWLALSAAREPGGAEAVWGEAVPFFVPLRQYARRGFPTPEALPQSVAGVLSGEMPAGWVSNVLRAGRAMLLVDGLDELEPGQRLDARTWLEHLVGAYPDARFVVSARPFAVPEDWLSPAGFVTYDLLPLSPRGMYEFLAVWHEAARQQHAGDPAMQELLDDCEAGLREQLDARPELRHLAGSPLLCGLLCALYQDRGMHLPRDRKGLYDAALDLLLVRWDEERGIRMDELPWLTKEEQVVLLQRFAYSLVKNHEIAVPRAEAKRRIGHAMRGLRSQELEAEPVLQRTLERSGLLREPSPDEVQFVHRTFRDYLAAKEVVDCGDLDFLVEQAHLDHWHDVVVNTVAHARPAERDHVLRRLLDGNTAARDDERLRIRLRLVAAACLEQADVLGTNEARDLVEQAAARLIPPATLDEADLLARAGRFVLGLLPGPDGLSADEAASVVRTAAMIGGTGVRERLAEFVPVAESRVVDELLRAWRRSEDPEDYARTVLADVDFGDRSLEVRSWHLVRHLPHLRFVTSVVCYGDIGSLGPLASVPRLQRLELVQNELVRDLSPLAARPTLRALALRTGCGWLRDLGPLADTSIEELGLHLVAADVRTLRPGRLRHLVIRDPRLRDGLDPIPSDLGLRQLTLDNPARSRGLGGIERWPSLEHVSLRELPTPDEIERLARLPALTRLTLRAPAPAGPVDLTRIAGLRRLDLGEVPREGVAAVVAALLLPPGCEVLVDGRSPASRAITPD